MILGKFRNMLLPLGASLVFFGLIFSRIHLPPITGMADQGDYERMMIWVGAKYQTSDSETNYFNWVNRYYDLEKPQIGQTFSSELVFLFIARTVNTWLHPQVFDLNVLGILHSLAYTAGLFGGLYYLKRISWKAFGLSIPFLFWAATDIAYVAYFNSFYQEAAGMIFMFWYLAILLKIIGDEERNITVNICLLVVVSSLLIAAKSQYFGLSLPAAGVIFLLFRKKVTRWLLAGTIFIVMSSGVINYLIGTPEIIKKWNVYNTVFAQIFGSTGNPQRAAKIIGVEDKYLKYSGIGAYVSGSGIDESEIQKYLGSGTFIRVINYYLATPREWFNLSGILTQRSFTTTVNYLGYYEDRNGFRPLEQPQQWRSWSEFKKNVLVKTAGGLPVALVVGLMGLTWMYFKTRNNLLIPGMFIFLSAITQLVIVTTSEGMFGSPEKHLLLFGVLCDMALLFCYLVIWQLIGKQKKRRPKLSVLISVFSGRDTQFEMSLQSVVTQVVDPSLVELVVFIDYTNSLSTQLIVKKYQRYFGSVKVFVATTKKYPVNHSASRRNFMATKATGEFIIFSEPEMFHLGKTIQRFLTLANRSAEKMWICGPVFAANDLVDKSGKVVDRTFRVKNLSRLLNVFKLVRPIESKFFKQMYRRVDYSYYKNPFFCTMLNRKFFLNLGGLNQNLKVRGFEELEFFQRFSAAGGEIHIDEQITTAHIPHFRSLDPESQISWNLYNSTVVFDPKQQIGLIDDAEFKQLKI